MSGTEEPGFGELADWVEGRLPAERAASVAARVANGDESTRRTVAWLHSFLDDARNLPLAEPPPEVRPRLAKYFDDWAAARADLVRTTLEDIEAMLMFDSRTESSLAGVRGAAVADMVFHLAYTTEAADLVLDVFAFGDRFRIEGQVLVTGPDAGPPFVVSATGPGLPVRSTQADEAGRFTLDGVPTGTLEVRAQNGQTSLVATVRVRDRP